MKRPADILFPEFTEAKEIGICPFCKNDIMMDTFTNKIGKFDDHKYADKTKNDIYTLIKENMTIRVDGNKGYIDGNADISLEGLDELTEVLYNYVQQEKAKQEVLTLERVKLDAAVGIFNIKKINENIGMINEKYKF